MGGFDLLTPDLVLGAVSQSFNIELDSTITPYPSYINRVYGLSEAGGRELVVKFYRPGRWTDEAILDEHSFLSDCSDAELPVVAPLADNEDDTLFAVDAFNDDGEETEFLFALFPKRGGRIFDAESEDAWLRLGRLMGRLHGVGARDGAEHRILLHPAETTRCQAEELTRLAHPDCRGEFEELMLEALERILPLFEGIGMQRIHGDSHRGNILDRGAEGLLLIDFDDMAVGPPVQDLWLLLPGRRDECGRELGLLIEGYEDFRPAPYETFSLIEPLRFMRMIHFMAWCGRQRDDVGFRSHFPDWGGRSYWITEIEDLRQQLAFL